MEIRRRDGARRTEPVSAVGTPAVVSLVPFFKVPD